MFRPHFLRFLLAWLPWADAGLLWLYELLTAGRLVTESRGFANCFCLLGEPYDWFESTLCLKP